ncbi:MAG: hypothetical protein LBB76_12460 [Azoarcus sp.]|jgi:hypothetical protein|nr:hypothetical protein [Azoarcus sp.]
MWIFDPPGYAIDALPQWRDYVAMLERTIAEGEDTEEVEAELEDARTVLAELEEQAKTQAA